MKIRLPKYFLCGIYVIFILFFSLSFSHAAILLDRVIAVVNKEVITWSDLYKMMESEAGDKVKNMDEAERLKIFKENEPLFLEKLIDFRLEVQDAERIGLKIGPDEIKDAIGNIKKKYGMTDAAFEEMLKKEGLDIDEYKKQLSEQILVRQYLNHQIKNKIVISDEEVKKYIEENRDNILDTEAYKLRQIFFKRPKDENEVKTLEEKIAAVAEKVKSGEDFGAIARAFSEDSTAKDGGDLGYVKKSLLAKEFLTVLESMKPGDISKPFWTQQGLHIIQLGGKTAERTTDQVREDVKNQLEEQQFMERYKILIRDLREKSHIETRL